MRRELGAFERAQTITDEYAPFNGVGVVRLASGPAVEAVRNALETLSRRHPLLTVRISKEGGRYFFDSPGDVPLSFSALAREGEGHWRSHAEEELNRPFDRGTAPLIRFSYIHEEEAGRPAELIVTGLHAILDATSGLHLIREALTLAADSGTGGERAAVAPLAPLPPAEELFPETFQGWSGKRRIALFFLRQGIDEVRYRAGTRGGRLPPIHLTARNRILSARIDRDATRALIRCARAERVSLNSILSAGILLAVNRHLYDSQPRLMRNFTFANLRPYLDPPVEQTHFGSYLSMVRLTTMVSENEGMWELARSLNKQVHDSMKRGDKFATSLLSPIMMKAILRLKTDRMGTTALSYTGAAPFGETVNGLEIRGLHVFVSNISLGPEFTVQARLFAGRIHMDAVYLDADMSGATAGLIAGDTINLLAAAGNSRITPAPPRGDTR